RRTPPPATGSAAVITSNRSDDGAVAETELVGCDLYDRRRQAGILLAQVDGGLEHPGLCLLDIIGHGETLDSPMGHCLVDENATSDESFSTLLDFREKPGRVVALVHGAQHGALMPHQPPRVTLLVQPNVLVYEVDNIRSHDRTPRHPQPAHSGTSQ